LSKNPDVMNLSRPLWIAGIIIITFGTVCLVVANTIGLKEEGEGFFIIGWRFIIGGIISIALGLIWKYRDYIVLFLRKGKYQHLYRP
jgi:hypothetical protein